MRDVTVEQKIRKLIKAGVPVKRTAGRGFKAIAPHCVVWVPISEAYDYLDKGWAKVEAALQNANRQLKRAKTLQVPKAKGEVNLKAKGEAGLRKPKGWAKVEAALQKVANKPKAAKFEPKPRVAKGKPKPKKKLGRALYT